MAVKEAPLVDQVAEAICRAQFEDDGTVWRSGVRVHNLYRRMAQAAIDALKGSGYTLTRSVTAEEEAENVW